MSDLPAWVYDVVMALQQWRDTHPKLYAEVLDQEAGDFVKKKVDDCGCKPLDHVPADILARATAIREYLASKEGT